MGNAKLKPTATKPKPPAPKSSPASAPTVALAPTPPLFRKVDWLTFAITTLLVWIGYYFTLAPDLTLEDSGELAVGSFYAGIPHPPGYPVWTIYTYFWANFLPFGNVAWRVALGEATAGAFGCGLLGLLVSRGSSMLMEGIEELKAMTGKWESAICMVSGYIAGMLLGFNGYMWSQAVIVEVYAFGVLSLVGVLVFLLRWIYAPHQRRFLYYAMFIFGICFTNHQSLLVAAMGIEIAIAAGQPKLGRDMFLANSVLYLFYMLLMVISGHHLFRNLEANWMMEVIFNAIGVSSIVACVWLTFKTEKILTEWKPVVIMGLLWVLGAAFYFYMPLAGMSNPPMQWGYPRTVEGFYHALSRGQYEQPNPSDIFNDPGRFIMQLGMLLEGIVTEFNWVFTFIAFLPFLFFKKLHRREKAWLIGITAIYLCLGPLLMVMFNPNPDRASVELTRVFFTASHVLVALLVGYGVTLISAYMATHYENFRLSALFVAVVTLLPALITLRSGVGNAVLGETNTAPAWNTLLIFGMLASAYVLAALAADKLRQQRQSGVKDPLGNVFIFLAVVALIVAGFMAFSGESISVASGRFWKAVLSAFSPDQYGLPVFGGLMLLGLTALFIISLLIYRNRAPLAICLGMFALFPSYSVLTHWADNEQRGHLFGYWFGHDMFTPPFNDKEGKPLYPEMTKDAVLFGGTDPGRFCPTYMIFCESFIPGTCKPLDPKFDRRDVYIITQNALADGTYLSYIRAHYNRSVQRQMELTDQTYGPFFQQLFRRSKEKELNYETNFVARLMMPLDRIFQRIGDNIEKERRCFTSWFTDENYTDFAAFTRKLRPADGQDAVSKYLFDNLKPETQNLLTGGADEARLRKALNDDLNHLLQRELEVKAEINALTIEKDRLEDELISRPNDRKQRKRDELAARIAELAKIGPLYETNRFREVTIDEYLQDFIKENPQSFTRIRLNRLLLEAAYPTEIAKTLGGVYPDREIYTPTPADSSRCFQEYLQDAEKRKRHDDQNPNAPRQIKPGEDVKFVTEGNQTRVQVAGQVAVMSINGLLTKVIFDNNPKNEFFVEESFPLDWMYPYLTPYGIIMKINRQPLPELTEEILERDHEFWRQFSERLIGNWITYDTSVKEIADFVEKVYLRHDFSDFKGDRKFVRDDQSQKAFSKLRSSIGGVYSWRVFNAKNSAEQQRMIKEADFALRQAFAFCPYSPEAVFRYAQLLANLQRFEDALLVAQTCLKLDPFNGSVVGLVDNLTEAVKQQRGHTQPQTNLQQLEAEHRAKPNDFQVAFNLASAYLHQRQTNQALAVLEMALGNPQADLGVVLTVAKAYADIGRLDKLEPLLEKLTTMTPEQAEVWYDYAALKAAINKPDQAIPALRRAFELNAKQLQADPQSRNLTNESNQDIRFNSLRAIPDFQQLVAPGKG